MWHILLFNLQVAQLSLEDAGQGSITLKTYYKYFLLGSGYVLFTVMCVLFLVSQVSNGQCSSEIYCVAQHSPCTKSVPYFLSILYCFVRWHVTYVTEKIYCVNTLYFIGDFISMYVEWFCLFHAG